METSTLTIREALASLRAEAVVWPDEPQFGAEVASFNLALQHAPDVVVVAHSTADVQAAVRAAGNAGMRISVQGAGHGEAPIVGGMLISTRHMTGVTIDPVRTTATVAAGTRWGEVIQAAAEYGLAPITGSSPLVGVVGFLLGGGFGPLVRSHGAGSDYLEAATLVTGSGKVVVVTEQEQPDLLWALRGGKFGLGVVTEMTVGLVPLPQLYAGALWFAEEHIPTVLRGWVV